MNESKTTTRMKFMTQNGINCMNEKKYHLDELVNLNGIVHIDGGPHGELDHMARVDDTCDINNHNTWMKLTNVDINDMDIT
jgi:hypothetical protein